MHPLGFLIAVSGPPEAPAALDLSDPEVLLELKTLMAIAWGDVGAWASSESWDTGSKTTWRAVANIITAAAAASYASERGHAMPDDERARYAAALSIGSYPSAAGIVMLPRYLTSIGTGIVTSDFPRLDAWGRGCPRSFKSVYDIAASCPVAPPPQSLGMLTWGIAAAALLGVGWLVMRRSSA